MQNIKIYAIKIKGGNEVDRIEVGTARVDPENVLISAEKYDKLNRSAQKLMSAPRKGEYISLITEDGKRDTFGGYPASGFLRVVKFDFKDTFPNELRAMIRKSNLSQRAFAEKLGIPLRTVEDWIAGKRTPNAFTKKSVLEQAEKILNEK